MRAFETVHAEPRDLIDAPNYRVNFWQQTSPEDAWSLDAFVLTEVDDVADALRWVDEHSHGRRFEVFAESDHAPTTAFEIPRSSGLVRLMGSNPNIGESVVIGTFTKS